MFLSFLFFSGVIALALRPHASSALLLSVLVGSFSFGSSWLGFEQIQVLNLGTHGI